MFGGPVRQSRRPCQRRFSEGPGREPGTNLFQKIIYLTERTGIASTLVSSDWGYHERLP